MEGGNKDVEKQSLITMESFKADAKGNVKLEPTFDEKEPWDIKLVAFVVIGILTAVFVIAEIGVALYIDSLVLISDGFHNLSDVVSLYIAYWAQKAQKRDISNEMSYGWARTEILGGLTNGCFLVSLCFYVLLESIPKFIRPEPMESGTYFLVVAGVGLAVNTIGTIVFAITGNAHGHSHAGGGGHSHSHGGAEKKKEGGDHGHSHSGGDHGHSHDHGDKKAKKEKKEKHSHSHSGGGDHGHSHDEPKTEKKTKRDMNVHAVFLHYLGDALSSVLVLIAGFLLKWFDGQTWTLYIDPISSLVIVVLIMWTTLPLIKRCSIILLQSTPDEVNMETLRKKMAKIEGLLSIHDLHVWQLVDGMFISSVHVAVEEGVDFAPLALEIKKVLHEQGIHSTSIQPEFIPRSQPTTIYCLQNCVPKCDEEWCCHRTALKVKKWGVELQSLSPKSDHV